MYPVGASVCLPRRPLKEQERHAHGHQKDKVSLQEDQSLISASRLLTDHLAQGLLAWT
jgi:hypothetical protein